jgi:hypothetical protein
MLHSPTMPRWRAVLSAMLRRSWWSASSRVCVGATTMDSPVWIPIGSTFSMLQTVTALSLPSRTISYSISFQPERHSSTSTPVPPASARGARRSSSPSVRAIAAPFPPSEKPARKMTGRPISRAAVITSASVCAWRLRATFTSISASLALKIARSSVASMASGGVPSTRTPARARTPERWSASPQLSAV